MTLRPLLLALAAPLALAACGEPAEPDPAADTPPASTPGAPASASASQSGAPTGSLSAGSKASTASPAGDAAMGTVDSNPPGDACGASKVAPFVAQQATAAVRARLEAEVGHDRIRWVGPDTVVTMDFRSDRLNVMLDSNDVITGGKCQ
ncbi:hypothetical protein GRI40_02060 [Altererythrobacter aerius]|uniref:Peptidase inhibitor I78 n=1 Tax=Tsuneonella aeria TaxID=1837929 RepID=A0A6I4TB71_9SPHN|nr:I78 family peptidase inhibitor [Tsuneonella aeria]MXO74004.1 hypothetical protein [Tsuneonella aeria]